jgi:hypothetical protein
VGLFLRKNGGIAFQNALVLGKKKKKSIIVFIAYFDKQEKVA